MNVINSSVKGKLNYLVQTSRPDIIFAVHQLTRFSADPHEDHGITMISLASNLKSYWIKDLNALWI